MNAEISSKSKELTEAISELRKSNPQQFLSLLREIRTAVREMNEEFDTMVRGQI